MGRNIINGGVHSWKIAPPPISSLAPAVSGGVEGGEDSNHWRSFDNSVNAVSFGFVATAILISMFLVMAIFERFLRRRSSTAGGRNSTDLVAQMRVQRKLDYPSPEMTFYANGVSVLMPGEEVPTFIAHPAPPPCPPECIPQPLHQDDASLSPASTSIGHSPN
ncbi:PREDICTED: uncharacterized protein LOC109243646 [Nicotiana attenuata]|uniref:Uncharacterized protein n=1 Tax=Nicotiana attenuata TaxID=49451 RepID=A0A314L2H8_NICAT|nr:PREDICTED: uncharacterized protein LOC109243646 [Nicotiana attenuata]OIT35219.1 hypothetical protein A4A49_27873 [Nicotiana attenuata]